MSTSEARFRQLADTIREVFFLTDPQMTEMFLCASRYLSKPIEPDELFDIVERHLITSSVSVSRPTSFPGKDERRGERGD